MRSTHTLLICSSLLVVGCDPDPPVPAASRDAGAASATDAAACDPPRQGCPCGPESEGFTKCGGRNVQCCGGRWLEFHDGPCWESTWDAGHAHVDGSVPADAGPMDCSRPREGCPCDSSTPICRPATWRLVCREGTWADDKTGWSGFSCCGG